MRSRILPFFSASLCLVLIIVCGSFLLSPWTGIYAARAQGNSMLPAMPTDALVVIRTRAPKLGEVVHVQTDEFNYVHRVVELTGEVVVTKGDNCATTEKANIDQVKGVVTHSFPFGIFLLGILFLLWIQFLLAVVWSGRLILSALLGRALLPSPT